MTESPAKCFHRLKRTDLQEIKLRATCCSLRTSTPCNGEENVSNKRAKENTVSLVT